MCVYMYILIFINTNVCVRVSVCVREWVVKEGILSSASLGVFLSILAPRPNKDLAA